MFLIIGLGNPGPRYELTRHNAGFLIADTLTEKHRIKLDTHQYKALYGKGEVDGLPVMVVKPMTYMNESGKAVKPVVNSLDILPQQIIVVYDEIDLPLGNIKVSDKGGEAGHLGLRSIIETLGTDKFARIRVWVGRPEDSNQISDYVLSPFLEEELKLFEDVMEEAVKLIEIKLRELNESSNETEEKLE